MKKPSRARVLMDKYNLGEQKAYFSPFVEKAEEYVYKEMQKLAADVQKKFGVRTYTSIDGNKRKDSETQVYMKIMK